MKAKTVVYSFDSHSISKGFVNMHLYGKERMFPTLTDTSKDVDAITVPALTHSALHKHKGQDQLEANALTYHGRKGCKHHNVISVDIVPLDTQILLQQFLCLYSKRLLTVLKQHYTDFMSSGTCSVDPPGDAAQGEGFGGFYLGSETPCVKVCAEEESVAAFKLLSTL